MTCTCECHNTIGHRINRGATLRARLVELDLRIPEVEKTARRTPPKTLTTEWIRVENAKRSLPRMRKERENLLDELASMKESAE